MNTALVDDVVRHRPDLLLFVPFLYEIWIETFDLIRALGVTTTCWTTDDSWKYAESSRFLGPHFDVIATTYEQIVPRYRRDHLEQVFLTQWAASTDALREPLPAGECRYDVTFIGGAYP